MHRLAHFLWVLRDVGTHHEHVPAQEAPSQPPTSEYDNDPQEHARLEIEEQHDARATDRCVDVLRQPPQVRGQRIDLLAALCQVEQGCAVPVLHGLIQNILADCHPTYQTKVPHKHDQKQDPNDAVENPPEIPKTAFADSVDELIAWFTLLALIVPRHTCPAPHDNAVPADHVQFVCNGLVCSVLPALIWLHTSPVARGLWVQRCKWTPLWTAPPSRCEVRNTA
mmetsp:Transcript_80117/g.221549  ORF Transcript_80117/g.221549 Transcript_80117/m.221549 type:complete len:224 (-) Transcript_80117:487-1158(-)